LAALDSAGQVPEAPYDGRSGEIEIFGLPALVQGLAESGASGLLRLKDPRGEIDAEIVLRAGRMKGCEARGRTGGDAFYQPIERPSPASYVFERQPADAKPEPSADNLPEFAVLCQEGMRRHDEFAQATVVVPDDARFSKTQVRPEHHADELDGMFVNGLWNLIVGGATAKDCEGALKADSFRIRRQLVHWVESGGPPVQGRRRGARVRGPRGPLLPSAALPLRAAVVRRVVCRSSRDRDADPRRLRLPMRPRPGMARAQRRGVAPEEVVGGPLDGDLAADQLLDRVEREDVVVAGERHRGSLGSGAARAADPVDVVLGVLGQVVVDDVRHAFDVEAARGHVGRDEDGEPSFLEVVQDPEP